MKILMHTMHASRSIGASLQACALGKKLKDMGHSPYLLYYVPPSYTDILIKKRNFNSIRTLVSSFINGQYIERERINFLKFKNLFHPPLTDKYTSMESLYTNPPKFDAYICGSDQVWNPNITNYDSSFFFNFIDENVMKLSYAASIGCDQITPDIKKFLFNGLSNMDCISVREDTAVKTVEECLPNSEVTQNIDPTFLLKYEELVSMECEPGCKIPKHYCLYYPLGNTKVGYPILEYIKNKYALPVVSFTSSIKKNAGVDYNLHGIGPSEFLYLCRHADIIITNSFHGFAIPLNMGKKVICYTQPGKNVRMESLSRLLHIEKLVVSSVEDLEGHNWDDIWESSIENISKIIDKERIRADIYLRKALSI